ncbi:site-2 protease family protein [Candidatus Dependentiae bacterium]|nr:site-2 protease family protein [Candidatus Dependentiae bacterium]
MERILLLLITYPVILISLSFHEFSHAFAADKLGDPTAKYLGRLTLNPIVHIDLVGTVIIPIFMALTGLPLFGWAKPVPVNPLNFRNTRRDMAIVSFAGPASNFILCIGSIILIYIFSIFIKPTIGTPENGMVLVAMILFFLPIINIFLMIFNMIPIPPLDGAGILRHFLPFRIEEQYDRIFGNRIVNIIVIVVVLNLFLRGVFSLVLLVFQSLLPNSFLLLVWEGFGRLGMLK